MKTIAVAIDLPTLQRLDARVRAGGSSRERSRSAIVRRAVRELLDRETRATREAEDAAVFAKHRERLAREARALVAEQAEP